MNSAWKALAAVCALVIGVYVYMAQSRILELLSPNPAESYYNLLVEGFRAGQLSLKKEIPPGLAQLPDPYDPTANAPYRLMSYRLHDLSYYKGRLYLYFGVTPALVLFWPFAALTGEYLCHRQAVVIFCAIGFLASVGLLRALWRRYFPEMNVSVVVVCALALGLATGVPVLLPRTEVYEVAISCGYMLTMLALGAIWRALHESERKCRWLAAASVAYGLAVGARPNLLFGAVVLLVPVAQGWRERRQIWALLAAAMGPILLIGLGLILYNALRFDNPFEFGQHYQLAGERQVTQQSFSLRYLWFNFQVYFLEPARWSRHFPFVQEMVAPPLPAGHGKIEGPFGVLTNIPLVWLALTVPLVWRNRSAEAGRILRWFVTALTLLFGICALSLCLFRGANDRYQVDFVPALLLLSVVGVLGLERALADRPVWRRKARWGWGLLLGFSVAFNLLASVVHYAEIDNDVGVAFEQVGRVQESIEQYEHALRIKPDYAKAHYNLGTALQSTGKLQEAVDHFEQALRIKPGYAEAHNNLGIALARLGRIQEAIGHFEQALRIKPDYAEAYYNMGLALAGQGKLSEAMTEFAAALQINPDYAEAHHALGIALERVGRVPEAMGHYEQALRIKPDYAEVHCALGMALEQAGRVREAIGHYEQALRIKPDFPQRGTRLRDCKLTRKWQPSAIQTARFANRPKRGPIFFLWRLRRGEAKSRFYSPESSTERTSSLSDSML